MAKNLKIKFLPIIYYEKFIKIPKQKDKILILQGH